MVRECRGDVAWCWGVGCLRSVRASSDCEVVRGCRGAVAGCLNVGWLQECASVVWLQGYASGWASGGLGAAVMPAACSGARVRDAGDRGQGALQGAAGFVSNRGCCGAARFEQRALGAMCDALLSGEGRQESATV